MNTSTTSLPTSANPAAAPTGAAGIENNKPRLRRQWTAKEKTDHLETFAESGLTQAEYCEMMELPPATFSLWCRQSRSGGEAASEPGSATGFAQVCVSEAPAASALSLVVVHLPNGLKVEAAAGTDASWLCQLVKSLSVS